LKAEISLFHILVLNLSNRTVFCISKVSKQESQTQLKWGPLKSGSGWAQVFKYSKKGAQLIQSSQSLLLFFSSELFL